MSRTSTSQCPSASFMLRMQSGRGSCRLRQVRRGFYLGTEGRAKNAFWSHLERFLLIIAGSVEVCLSTCPVPQCVFVPMLASCFACRVGEASVEYGRFGGAFSREPNGGRRLINQISEPEICRGLFEYISGASTSLFPSANFWLRLQIRPVDYCRFGDASVEYVLSMSVPPVLLLRPAAHVVERYLLSMYQLRLGVG